MVEGAIISHLILSFDVERIIYTKRSGTTAENIWKGSEILMVVFRNRQQFTPSVAVTLHYTEPLPVLLTTDFGQRNVDLHKVAPTASHLRTML